jgi:alpha-L-rhamnosidase
MPAFAATPVTVSHLRCEFKENPLGIDVLAPRLSWRLNSSRRGEMQTAYRILVASDTAKLKAGTADLWDSGIVKSSDSRLVPYAGRPLTSRLRACWRVQVWDREGEGPAESAPAWWEMGLLTPSDWKASWILSHPGGDKHNLGPATYFRKQFALHGPVASARAYVSALGLYKLYINGHKVGNDYFTPGWTDYHKRVQYETYDVTRMLAHDNTLNMVLGDGWYSGHIAWAGRQNYGEHPHGLLQLEITYRDGSHDSVVTDGTWSTSLGSIVTSDLLMGEAYDARREAGSSGWTNDVTSEPVTQNMVAPPAAPIRKVTELHPKSIMLAKDGTYIVDLAQNMVGWARMRVHGPAGTTVTLRFGEMLNPDGTLYTTNLRGARATDTYTLKGSGTEVYEPSFTFHGFRYVALTGYPGVPDKSAITGIVLHSDTPRTGTFECSNPLVNQLEHNIYWGQMGNYFDVPTDCPQRDERLGWMGDAEVFAPTACYNMDVAAFLTKWMHDVDDGQSADGAYGDVSPRVAAGSDGSPAWGDAGVIVPWTEFLAYGDYRMLEHHYDAMARWIEYIHKANPDLIWRNQQNNSYGDWLNVGEETPHELLATAYFAHDAFIMAHVAIFLGRRDEGERYFKLFEQIRDAFQREFLQKNGRLKGNTQTAYVLAIEFNLLSGDQRTHAGDYLTDLIVRQRKTHLATGFLGVGELEQALTDTGHLNVAYQLLQNDTYPSWGYSIRQGATTIWERWDGWTKERGFQDPGMNSFNHYSLGSVGAWMMNTVGGIAIDRQGIGYSRIQLHPMPGGGLTHAHAALETSYGLISSDWHTHGSSFRWKVTVPPNTVATAYVPATSVESVTEGGVSAASAEGVKFLRQEAGFAVYEIGSGSYEFEAR